MKFLFCLYSTPLPQARAESETASGLDASRDFHPSEDLSELPPLLASVAGQEYPHRQGPRNTACHGLFPERMVPLCTFFGRLWCRLIPCTGGLRASLIVAFPSPACRWNVFLVPDMQFSRCMRKSPLIREGDKIAIFHTPFFKKFFILFMMRLSRFDAFCCRI